MKSIRTPAKTIATLLTATKIEVRGTLLRDIATELRKKGQNYTASLFEDIARVYDKS